MTCSSNSRLNAALSGTLSENSAIETPADDVIQS